MTKAPPHASAAAGDGPPELLPVRMLNEVVYCERLFALEWPAQEWADSADTIEGRTVHRRVDTPSRDGLAADPDRPSAVRSVHLSDETLGLVARIDLVHVDADGIAVPIDYKRGKPPDNEHSAWEPERVQVAAQALLLRASGFRCEEGAIWYAAARRRVSVPITDDLVATTLRYRDRAREIMASGKLPPPLVDSPKCPRCSLVGICLPDEHNWLEERSERVRPLLPQRDDSLPLYIRAPGGVLSKDHDEIVLKDRDGKLGRARMIDTSRVVVLGNTTVSTPLLHALADRDIPVAWHSSSGWFKGMFVASTGRNVMTRIAQHRAAADARSSLELSRAFVHSKIANSRVLLRRNSRDVPEEVLLGLQGFAHDAQKAESIGSLLGTEGSAARLYFQNFHRLLAGGFGGGFEFTQRNRRPPRDPINAMLSFAYSVLVREMTIMSHGIGLDPYVGFLHQPRYGRPALALDLMEEFRPVLAESAVITAVNNGVVGPEDFITRATGVALRDAARHAFIGVIERRLDEVATHAVFGTRLSYRRILEVQARLLGKVLLGELTRYPEYRVR